MSLLHGFQVVQIGHGLATAVCGRLFADVGASVGRVDPDRSTLLTDYLNQGMTITAEDVGRAIEVADLIICEGSPSTLRARGQDPDTVRRANRRAVLVLLSPFGQNGPRAEDPATDLTVFFSSGIARMLTGQVDDLDEAPIRPVGEQSSFIGGLAAACAGMHAALLGLRDTVTDGMTGAVVDVSIQEALATLAMTELTRAGQSGKGWSRQRVTDGNGATVCILPARDGYAAISPREDRQWASWLTAMGSPTWGSEPRFAGKIDRAANWDALHALMSDWSRNYDKQWIADTAQAAHVPSFPLREPAEQIETAQLQHRGFYRPSTLRGEATKLPSSPFGLRLTPGGSPGGSVPIGQASGTLPLAGVRVLDFSWVIAGPTATRYLAAMGADVIKVEAPGSGDPGRSSGLHTVLGQAKQAIVLDLKKPEAVEIAKSLAAQADVLVENFASGVMDRLGLGVAELRSVNPQLIYVSASGLGRTGPESHAVAYGTLLQCYAGFAGLNRHPGAPPRVGLAWLDPMCGLMLAFVVAASVWQRQRSGGVARVDFSMIEAMLWTMAEPLLATQLSAPPLPRGNEADDCAPHSVWRCAGHDNWIAIAVTDDVTWRSLCSLVPALSEMTGFGLNQRKATRTVIQDALGAWLRSRDAYTTADALLAAGIAAAAAATSLDLLASPHLRERAFWDAHGDGVLPGLPWRTNFGRASGVAPGHGANTDNVLATVLGLSTAEITQLRNAGALG